MIDRFTLLVLFLLAAGPVFSQYAQQEYSWAERAESSTLLIEGRVLEQTSRWNAAGTHIYTLNSVAVSQVFKGSVNQEALLVVTSGGTVDLRKEEVHPSLQLSVGDIGLFELIPSDEFAEEGLLTYRSNHEDFGFTRLDEASGQFTVFGKTEGIEKNDVIAEISQVTDQRVTRNAIYGWNPQPLVTGGPFINSFSPGTISAGTASILTISGSGFGAYDPALCTVEFPNADTGGAAWHPAVESEIVSWTASEIEVMVPGKAGTGDIRVVTAVGTSPEAGTLTVPWAISNPSTLIDDDVYIAPATLIDANGSGGYTFQYFTGFAGSASASDDFDNTLTTWQCATGVNWERGPDSPVDATADDGISIVRFDNGSELPEGVLGTCTSYYSGCLIEPNIYWQVTELDMTFDDGANWFYGGGSGIGFSQYDFLTVSIHEIGHGHQLGHVTTPGDAMYYQLANSVQLNTLNDNNVTAGQFVVLFSQTEYNCSDPIFSPNYCSSTGCYGDLNADGDISTADLLIIIGEYGCAGACSGDLSGDGQVSSPDILNLLGVFGTSCS